MPAVHRLGDARNCGASTIVIGQGSVFANSKLVSVLNDINTHKKGELLASNNDGTVFAGGLPIVLLGSTAKPDLLCPSAGGPHCLPIAAAGSGNVFGC